MVEIENVMSGPSRWFTGERMARSFFAASAVVIGVGLVLQLVLAVQNDDALFATAAGRAFNLFCYFTVLSNITVAVTTGLLAIRLARPSITFRVFRVVGVIALTVTGIVYYVELRELQELTGWDALADLLLHTAGPILAPLGWLVFGPRRGIDAHIVGQAVLPLLGWLAFTLVRGALVEDRRGGRPRHQVKNQVRGTPREQNANNIDLRAGTRWSETVGPPDAGLLQIFHLARMLSLVSSAVEIRPGSVQAHELEVIERVLARNGGKGARLVDSAGDPVEMPAELVGVLKTIVEHLRAGHGVSVASLQAELTTVEAAELLNVSRPHLIKLLDGGALPFRMVGTHRRLRLVDVLAYRDSQDIAARAALDELTRQAEDLGRYD